jgi:hypothetical protein
MGDSFSDSSWLSNSAVHLLQWGSSMSRKLDLSQFMGDDSDEEGSTTKVCYLDKLIYPANNPLARCLPHRPQIKDLFPWYYQEIKKGLRERSGGEEALG